MTDARNDMASRDTPDSGNAGRLPDFLVIGAMKAGTTTLHAYLARHPGIFTGRTKEPGFFSRDERFAKGLDHYRRLWIGAAPDQLCGEASTCYSRRLEFPNAAPRIAEHVPDVKLVYLLRHPVDRTFSHYTHEMAYRWAKERLPLSRSVDALEEYPTLVDSSLYDEQLKAFLEFFPATASTSPPWTACGRMRLEAPGGLHLSGPGPFPRADRARDPPQCCRERGRASRLSKLRFPQVPLAAARSPHAPRPPAPREAVGPRCAISKLTDSPIAKREVDAFWALMKPPGDEDRSRLHAALDDSTRTLETMTGRDLSAWRRT